MPKLTAGAVMPNLTVNTVTDSDITLKDLAGGKPTMFMVLRYIGCTVCRYDVHLLTEKYGEFTAKNVNVVVVMQSTREIVERDLAGQTLPFQLICDPTLALYKEFEIDPAPDMKALAGNVRDRLMAKGAEAKEAGFVHGDYEGVEEQLPAFFYVDGDLNIKEAHYSKDIMDMPTVEEMLAKI